MKNKKYRVSNWKSYNKSLINRGDLRVWFDEESLKRWQSDSNSGERASPRLYSNAAIVCMLTKVRF